MSDFLNLANANDKERKYWALLKKHRDENNNSLEKLGWLPNKDDKQAYACSTCTSCDTTFSTLYCYEDVTTALPNWL